MTQRRGPPIERWQLIKKRGKMRINEKRFGEKTNIQREWVAIWLEYVAVVLAHFSVLVLRVFFCFIFWFVKQMCLISTFCSLII